MQPVVIVTGASRGLGNATAHRLLAMGAALCLTARGKEALDSAAQELLRSHGGNILTLAGDVASADFCGEVIRQTLQRFGRLDALINNAGILPPIAAIASADPQGWRYNIEVNLLAPFYLTREAIPVLRQTRGRVINISSGAAVKPVEGWSAYCAAKAALTHFTCVLALEEPEITAVALRPGVVDTAMQELIRREGLAGMSAERAAYFRSLKEQGRLKPPEVPARSAAWLALYAPRDWSGEFIDYDDPRIAT